MRTGFLSYRILAPVAALAVVALVVSAAEPEPPRPAVAEVAVQQPAPTGTILLRELDRPRERYRFATLTPDGKTETEFATPKGWPETTTSAYDALRTPDGKRVVLTAGDTRPRKNDGTDPPMFPSYLCSFPDGKGLTPFGGDYDPAYWSRDGGTLVIREYPPDHDTNPNDIGKYVSVDLKTGKRTDLPIPKDHWLRDQSPDGKHFLTVGKDPSGKLKGNRLFLLDRDGRLVRPLTDESMVPGPARFGPDGQWVLLRAAPRSAISIPGTLATKLYRTGIENPKPELLTDIPDTLGVMGFALSPDARWVAFDHHARVPGSLNPKKMHDPEAETKDEVEFAVVVVGLDGKNPRTIRSVKTKKPFSVQLHVIDWR